MTFVDHQWLRPSQLEPWHCTIIRDMYRTDRRVFSQHECRVEYDLLWQYREHQANQIALDEIHDAFARARLRGTHGT